MSEKKAIFEWHRSPRTTKVPVSALKGRKVDFDPVFLKLYGRFLAGDITVAYTRFSRERITEGYFRLDPVGYEEHILDSVPQRDEELLIGMIKEGHRPPLFIYANQNRGVSRYVCPDDAAAYRGYARLGIKQVPVAILDPSEADLEESALIVKGIGPRSKAYPIERFVSAQFDSIPSVLGEDGWRDFSPGIQKLHGWVQTTAAAVRAFHSSNDRIHYHHTLHSVLHRTASLLRSCELLVESGAIADALPLLRSLYELSLNFYVDWLEPEIVGSYLQMFAQVSSKRWRALREDLAVDKVAQGWTEDQIAALRTSDARVFNLLTKVVEKARVNPLAMVHEGFYDYLSRVAHQDFSITAQYMNTIEESSAANDPDELFRLLQYLDIIVTLIVVRIRDDIGL